MNTRFSFLVGAAFCGALCAPAALALDIIEPSGNNDFVSAGRDYATQVLNNPWDADDAEDVETHRTGNMTAQTFSGGIYSAVTTTDDPGFYLLDEGLAGTTNLSRGEANPIVTADYRYLTVKVRYTATAPGVVDPQGLLVYFYEDGSSTVNQHIGLTNYFAISLGSWQILTIDLISQINPGSVYAWTAFPTVKGLRIDPTTSANVKVELDWARLTASTPGPATENFTVTWNDTQTGPYTISAVDTSGAVAVLATNVNGTSRQVSLANLAPGPWRIRVSRAGATVDSPGVININNPPRVIVQSPSARGDVANSYSIARLGRPWGPFSAADIDLAPNVTNIRYDDPVGSGSVAGRPLNGDPGLLFKTTGAPIDANLYRSLCFTAQNYVPESFNTASVARIFWGNTLTTMTATKDIFLKLGLHEYCLADLATTPVEAGAPVAWNGLVQYFRYDPHEMPVPPECASAPSLINCREFRLDRLTLAPFAGGMSGFNYRWTLQDPDSPNALVRVLLDPDRIRGNGNEVLVSTNAASSGAGSMATVFPAGITPGLYYVAIEANDGLNTVRSYSTGPLRVLPMVDLIFRDGF